MFRSRKLLSVALVALGMTIAVPLGSARVPKPKPDLDPESLRFTPPDQIKWVEAPNGGAATAVLVGDPSKPGLYIVLTKWHAHHNSRPHSHPNDRYITVLSGTWWVNTGSNYDPDHMVPMPAGSYVVHPGGHVHYDGAKDGDAVLEIVGMGPATTTSAEK